MNLLSLVTSGVNANEVNGPDEDILGVVEGWEEDESHNPDVPAVSHKRGLKPFVFIPFEEVHITIHSGYCLTNNDLTIILKTTSSGFSINLELCQSYSAQFRDFMSTNLTNL